MSWLTWIEMSRKFFVLMCKQEKHYGSRLTDQSISVVFPLSSSLCSIVFSFFLVFSVVCHFSRHVEWTTRRVFAFNSFCQNCLRYFISFFPLAPVSSKSLSKASCHTNSTLSWPPPPPFYCFCYLKLTFFSLFSLQKVLTWFFPANQCHFSIRRKSVF
jgi:hypothetical protein